jgi:hypothetical protein
VVSIKKHSTKSKLAWWKTNMTSLGCDLVPTPSIVTAHDTERFVEWITSNVPEAYAYGSLLYILGIGNYRIEQYDMNGPMYPLRIGISTIKIPQALIDQMIAKKCIQKSLEDESVTFEVMVEGTCVGEITFVSS